MMPAPQLSVLLPARNAAHWLRYALRDVLNQRSIDLELLVVDDQLRDVIARNPNVAEFRRLCLERGMVTLRADGIRKVAKGQTSVEEVMRSTESTI